MLGGDPLDSEVVEDPAGDRGVAVVGREGLAPGVEDEVHPGTAAVAGDDDRPGIPHPGIVDRRLENLHVRLRHPAAGVGRLGRVNDQENRLELGDRCHHLRMRIPCFIDRGSAPGLLALGPGDQSHLVGRPLGGHAEFAHWSSLPPALACFRACE